MGEIPRPTVKSGWKEDIMFQKNLKTLLYGGILAALSFVLMRFIEFPLLPQAPFLKTDLGDIPVIIGAYFFGPIMALAITFVKDAIYLISGAGSGVPIGVLMNLIAVGTFSVVLGLITMKKKSKLLLLLGFVLATVALVIVMIPTNLWSVPIYLPGTTKEQVWSYIITVNIPFNILKCLIDSVVGFLIIQALDRSKIFK